MRRSGPRNQPGHLLEALSSKWLVVSDEAKQRATRSRRAGAPRLKDVHAKRSRPLAEPARLESSSARWRSVRVAGLTAPTPVIARRAGVVAARPAVVGAGTIIVRPWPITVAVPVSVSAVAVSDRCPDTQTDQPAQHRRSSDITTAVMVIAAVITTPTLCAGWGGGLPAWPGRRPGRGPAGGAGAADRREAAGPGDLDGR